MEREEIVKRLDILRDEQRDLRRSLELLDEQQRYKNSKQYVGKVYQNNDFSDCIHYTYIYGVCDVTKEPLAIELFKTGNIDDFSISHTRNFNPGRRITSEYVEISKDLFDEEMDNTLSGINKLF